MRSDLRPLRGLRSSAFIALALLSALGQSRAQPTLPYDWTTHWSPDPAFGGAFGEFMQVADVNQDGFLDLVASDSIKMANGLGGAGKVFVLFGPTLTSWSEIVADDPTFTENMGYRSLVLGDANGDGELDVLVGSPGYDAGGAQGTDIGRAHLFLGPDFGTDIVFDAPVQEVDGTFGWAVELVDIDGDGLDDVAIGAPNQSRTNGSVTLEKAGRAWLWNATDLGGTPVELVQPKPQHEGVFGWYLRAVPTSGNGEHLLVVAPGYDVPTSMMDGFVYRFGGPQASLLGMITPPIAGGSGFARLQHLVDVDADGSMDLVATGFGGTSHAAVLRGLEYEDALALFSPPPGDEDTGFAEFGAPSDLDRDGDVDILLASAGYAFNDGAVYVYWGPDYSTWDLVGPGWFPLFVPGLGNGLQVGDVDGDGYDEIFAQTPGGFSGGIVYAFRRRTLQADATSLSIGAGDSVTFTLDLPPDQAGHGYLAALSLSLPGAGLVLGPGSYLPLLPDGMTTLGLSLLGTPILDGFVGTLDAQGNATLTLNWPAHKGANLTGSMLHVAVIAADAEGQPGAGSNEVSLVLEP